MQTSATDIHIEDITSEDIEEFHRQREKIHAAVHDKLVNTAVLHDCLAVAENLRLSDEVSRHFIDLFYTSVKFDMPQRIIDYVGWLRNFLGARGFHPLYLPHLVRATRQAAHAFVADASSDAIGCTLHAINEQYVQGSDSEALPS